MADIDRAAVEAALAAVRDPASGKDVVSAGLLDGVATRAGHVQFALKVDPAMGAGIEKLRQACETAVRAIPGIQTVTAVMTAERPAARPPAPHHHAGQRAGRAAPADAAPGALLAPGVKHIVAVASGKGGVGKSTTAVNLALGLVALGRRVGLLDADIYGPSMPRMLKVTEKPTPKEGGRILSPIERHGLKTMS